MEDSVDLGWLPKPVSGLYIDDFNKIRIFEPEAEQRTSELQEGCKEFVEKTDEFCQLAGDMLQLTERLGKDVEIQKIKVIGYRNTLRSLAKEKVAHRQQLEALIYEKKNQLERLHLQYDSLTKVEMEQNEFMNQFLLQN